MKPKIFFLLLIFFVKYAICDDYDIDINKIQISDDFEKRSRIIMLDQNMWINAGSDGNITFMTSSGGRILIDEIDVQSLIHFASFRSDLERSKTLFKDIGRLYIQSATVVSRWRRISSVLDKMQIGHDDLVSGYKKFQKFQKNQTSNSDTLKRHLDYWQSEVEDLEKKLNNSACEKVPCKNGGICIPRMGDKFLCLCSHHWSGDTCEDEVDECLEVNRCRNGGTCVNTKEGYECNCKDGFHGPLCEFEQVQCSTNTKLCGPHGACVNTFNKTYDCKCHAGYKKTNDPKNPTCVDVDECLTNPCHPGVECINLDGSYQCYGCPPGFKMDHIGCVDVNECQSVGACAKGVECQNFLGSYECGPCPPGYSGNSKKRCTKDTPCSPNPCQNNLICLENDHILNPDGYICGCDSNHRLDSNTSTCVESETDCTDLCFNGGLCEFTGEGVFKCNCPRNYVGALCEHASPCFSNPCENGVCQVKNEREHICICDHNHYGELCEYEENMYDVHLTNLTGNFSFNIPDLNRTITQRTYIINNQPNSVLKLKLRSRNLFQGNCDVGKLFVYDGRDENARILKTFCKINLESFTMTTSNAMLEWIGNSTNYELEYEVVPRDCGYRTSKTSGHLAVPQMKQNIVCQWSIEAPMNKLIKIKIPSISMSSGNNISCETNRLELFDGFSSGWKTTIEKICSNVRDPYSLLSTGPALNIEFTSNFTGSGFSLQYEVIDREDEDCGFIIDNKNLQIGLTGYIESPNYGSLYPPNSNCYWQIFKAGQNQTRDDFAIKITFEAFHVGYYGFLKLMAHACSQNFLKLIEMKNDEERVFCALFSPRKEEYMIFDDTLIHFKSGDFKRAKGFKLKYEIVCQQTLRGNGSIQTWNFPNGGGPGKCFYTIESDSFHTIELKFKSIGLNVFTREECRSKAYSESNENYFKIRGDSIFSSFACKSGSFVENGTISANGRKPLQIEVSSDGNSNFKGISFEYYTHPIGCGGLVTEDEFTSPGFPFNYPSNKECVYRIESNDSIVITFEEFNLTSHKFNFDSCENDRIELLVPRDKMLNKAKFCGDIKPPPITVARGHIEIVFYSGNVTSSGFRARVDKKPMITRDKCEYTITRQYGLIEINTAEAPHCNSVIWYLSLPRHSSIHFDIIEMNIPCDTSQLSVYNHIIEKSHSIYDACPSANYKFFQSTPSVATIVLTNITANKPASFTLRFVQILECSGHKAAQFSGFIASPQYPHRERRNSFCEWRISASHGNRLKLKVSNMDDLTSYDQNCTTNFLNIFEGDKFGPQLASLCHKTTDELEFTSKEELLTVIYNQDLTTPENVFGFYAQFETVCQDIVLTESHGVIQSPGYPNPFSSDVKCSWTIKVPAGNRVVIKFSEFNVQTKDDDESCYDNHLKIDDSDLKAAVMSNATGVFHTIDNKYCQTKSPVEIQSRHNVVHLYYISSIATNKFMLQYHTSGCVREILTSQEIKITRDSIDLDREYIECRYTIKAPFDKKVHITINSFKVAHNDGCKYSQDGSFRGMALIMGTPIDSKVPQQVICSTDSTYEYESHTSQLTVIISLDERNIQLGRNVLLDASVTFVDSKLGDKCGGNINLSHNHQTNIMSPNYPSPYSINEYCEWNITCETGYHIKFHLIDFNTINEKEVNIDQNSLNRTGHISISSSDVVDGALFKKILTEPTIVDQYIVSQAIVRFNGAILEGSEPDYKQNKTGFLMSLKQACGGIVFAANEEKKLNLEFEEGENCSIIIKSSDENGVQAAIEFFDDQENQSTFDTDIVTVYVDGRMFDYYHAGLKSPIRYKAKQKIVFDYATKSKVRHRAVIRYGPTSDGCYVISSGRAVPLYIMAYKELDCQWTIENTPGNKVAIKLRLNDFPKTPHCAASYIEVRLFNSTGQLLSRDCSTSNMHFEGQSLYMRIKFTPDIKTSSTRITGGVEKIYGGETTSRILKAPKIYERQKFEWKIDSLDKPHILIKITEVFLGSSSSIKIKQSSDDRITDDAYDQIIRGFSEHDPRIFHYKDVTIQVDMWPNDNFTIEWKPVDENDYNKTNEKIYDCGGHLSATWEWQEITSPLPPGQTSGYEDNIHCLWTIDPEHLSGIVLQFEHLDLEDDPECVKDFVTITREELEEDSLPSHYVRYCHLPVDLIRFYYEKTTYINFVTDNGGSGTGFKLKFRLSCKLYFSIPISTNMEYTLTSPKYESGQADCRWHIESDKNRPISVEIEKLQIGESEQCDDLNYLSLRDYKSDKKLCGKYENLLVKSIVSADSYMNIEYKSDGDIDNHGFKLTFKDIIAECPGGNIELDELHGHRHIYSPEYPREIPSSMECEYVVSVPQGFRIELSFDPDDFNMEEAPENDKTADFLEIRDGSSQHSHLIGIFRGKTPPSSLFSTENFMYMRLHTNERINSKKFVASFHLMRCGGTVNLGEKNRRQMITAPKESACEWTIRTANTHTINTEITELWSFSNKAVCENSTIDVSELYMGKRRILFSQENCTKSNVTFVRSLTSKLFVSYIRMSDDEPCKSAGCGFKISFAMSEESCGGTINNASGIITLPGYPEKLLPHVRCTWKFKADPRNVYELKFKFTGTTNYNSANGCYEDITFYDHLEEQISFPYGEEKHFCVNNSKIISIMDEGFLIYDDQPTLNRQAESSIVKPSWYAPFQIEYRNIPADFVDTSCTSIINYNVTFPWDGTKQKSLNFADRCHLIIENPEENGSVNIKVHNFQLTRSCNEFNLNLRLKSSYPTDIDHFICDFRTPIVLVSPSFEVFLFNLKTVERYNLAFEVNFQECGGYIRTPSVDVITSPNYKKGNYLSNSSCKWVLEAPVGQVIQIRVIEMDIKFDYDCKNDRLVVGEGRQFDMNVLTTYCHTMNNVKPEFKGADLLQENFKKITTKGRFMTLLWISDAEKEDIGWKLEYEFVNEGKACGNHQQGLKGVIHTKNYGVDNYLPNQECSWSIEVPPGFHIKLHYTYFKIEKSDNCQNDGLQISSFIDHAGIGRTGDAFSTRLTTENPPICGYELPPDYVSNSQKLSVVFKSDDQINESGFHLNWEAKCGREYTTMHGTITSPNYPKPYDHIDEACEYTINAGPTDHISLKIEDFDMHDFDALDCRRGDNIQIVRFNSDYEDRFCGTRTPSDDILLVGPVKIIYTREWDFDKARGFKLHYTINRCGGNVHLEEGGSLSTVIEHERFTEEMVLNCDWNITTTPGRELVIKFEYFHMAHGLCDEEYVEFFDSENKTTSLGRYCGGPETMPTHTIQSKGSTLIVHAHSVRVLLPITEPKLFKIIVSSTLGAKSGCGGELIASESPQFLTPPKKNDGYGYPSHISCGWLIESTTIQQIVIQIHKIEMDSKDDRLKIYDGLEGMSQLLFNESDEKSLGSLEKISAGREVFLRFDSRFGGEKTGFNISYMVHNEKNGGIQFAEDSLHNIHLNIHTARSERIHIIPHVFEAMDPIFIRFLDLNLTTSDCSEDYVEVRDVSTTAKCKHPLCAIGMNEKNMVKLCKGEELSTHISSTNAMRITIRVSGPSSIKYEYRLLAGCNRTINTNEYASGHLVSQSRPSSSQCITKLFNPLYETQTKKLLLVFKNAYGFNVTENHINRTAQTPRVYFSESGDIVKIISRETSPYEASYYTVSSESDNITEFATIHTSEGVVANMEFPEKFIQSMTQIFTIDPPKTQQCKFHTSQRNFGIRGRLLRKNPSGPSKEYAIVQQYRDGEVIEEKKYDKDSYGRVQDFRTEDGVRVKITFVTDDNSDNDGDGFMLHWKCYSS